MNTPETFIVIGGDRRMEHLARYLRREHSIIRITEAVPASIASNAHLLFPMPFSRNGTHISGMEDRDFTLEQLNALLMQKPKTIFGGALPTSVSEHCKALEIPAFDWMEMEDVVLPNAGLTAEGAIAEAILHTNRSLHNSRCLILGWGRCAQTLARRLRYLVNEVVIAARNPFQRLGARSEGFSAVSFSELFSLLPDLDLIFNTVPAMILPGEYAASLSDDNIFLDLASGKISDHMEKDLYRGKAVLCPGLPGKYFAKDAGEILAQAALARIRTTS